MSSAPPPLVILGATAVGKTAVAVEVARLLGAEIVSFDASCVYRGLDIGTAKPTAAQRASVRHHLVDVCDPSQAYSAGQFVKDALTALADLEARGVPAVLAGGTGMYLRALLRGLDESPARSAAWRERLGAREKRRPGSLHRLLRRLDPEAAARLGPRDEYRLARALEFRLVTGRRFSDSLSAWKGGDRLPAVKVGLELPRELREERIRLRVDAMLSGGLLDEVRGLLEAGVAPDAPSFRALGYRDVVEHLAGRLPLDELRLRMVVSTRQYAKRQDTWFRREPGVRWLAAPRSEAELPEVVSRVMLFARAGACRDTREDGCR